MTSINRGTKAEIITAHLKHNLSQFRNLHAGKIIAVVKADAYGHGIQRVIPHLSDCDAFAVATINEAILLRKLDGNKRIILLEGVFNQIELNVAVEQKFDLVVHQKYQLELLQQSNDSAHIDVWLKIDTGMSRLGFSIEQAKDVINELTQITAIKQLRLMTHFASADDPNSVQTKRQIQLNEQLKSLNVEYSFSNTAAVLNHLSDQEEWARVGIGLFGISPLHNKIGNDFGLKSVMQLKAKVIAIKEVAKGQLIGYSGTYQAQHDMKIGVIGIGYADGYPWTKQQSHVMIDGQMLKVVGRVSMDMMMVDVTDSNDVNIGSTALLWGTSWPIESVANEMELIPYALCCGITNRVKYYDIQ